MTAFKNFWKSFYAFVFLSSNEANKGHFVEMVIFSFIMAIVFSQTAGDYTFGYLIFGFLFCYGGSVVLVMREKPNLNSLFPITYRQRIVHAMLFPWLIVIFMTIFIVLFLAVMSLLTAVITLIATGDWILTAEEMTVSVTIPILGNVFFALEAVMLIYVGVIYAYMNTQRARIIFGAVCAVVWEAGAVVLNRLAGGGFFYNLMTNFLSLPLPWLAVTLAGVTACALVVTALLLVIKHEKPQNI